MSKIHIRLRAGDGRIYPISRDVRDVHPDAVHEALGTSSEAELQEYLDGLNFADWYDIYGNYLGPDSDGLEMWLE